MAWNIIPIVQIRIAWELSVLLFATIYWALFWGHAKETIYLGLDYFDWMKKLYYRYGLTVTVQMYL